MNNRKQLLVTISLCLLAWMATACAGGTRHHSSSVVDYLYPGGARVTETAQVPRLALPVRVGVAFVPENRGFTGGFTEVDKDRLLVAISKRFREHDFVGSITIIPSAYLVPGGSFTNLDQVGRMYDIDVVALVAFDQTQFTDSGAAALTYWTLIGAYLVPGEKNDTHTMMDATVYDIESRSLLFRAPGVSHMKGRSTPVNLSEQLRRDSMSGFELASEDLVTNLSQELADFRLKLREAPEQVQLVRREGYVGGGAVDPVFLLLLLLALGYRIAWSARARV
jgi:rhombotail lipoprotein